MQTAGGTVTAGHVLLCTNAYTDDLWPGLRQTIVPVRGYQIWTGPLGNSVARTILPSISAINDSRRLITDVRRYPDGRLHFGGRPRDSGASTRPTAPPTSAVYCKELFPQIDTLEVEQWWSGWVTRGISDGWRLHELAPGLMTAIACNGRGVAMGPIIGREVARYVGGTPERDLLVPLSTPEPIRYHALHQSVGSAMVRYYAWQDNRELKRLRALRHARR